MHHLLRSSYLAVVSGAVLLSMIGCTNKKSSQQPQAAAPRKEKTTVVANGGVEESSSPTLKPRQIAEEFLKSLGEGQASVDALAPSLRTRIAPPFHASEKAVGFSEQKAKAWLSTFPQGKYTIDSEKTLPIGSVFRGTAPVAGKSAKFTLIVDAGKIAWLHTAPLPVEMSRLEGSAELAAASEICRAFVETLIGSDLKLCQLTLSPALKADLAPPFASEKDLGFSPAKLENKLKSLRGDGTATIREAKAEGSAVAFRVSLGSTTYRVVVAKEATGYSVQTLEPQ